jgi:hypothetical protein
MAIKKDAPAYPEDELFRIQLWCREIVPEDEWGERQVIVEAEARHITIIEMRRAGGEWTQLPIARLRYQPATRRWHLYWRGFAMGFQEYRSKWPARKVQSLLDFLATTTDPVFWN